MRKLKLHELGRKTVEEFIQTEKLPLRVVLDDIRSGHNVGSVFRTSDAFLVDKVYLCGKTPAPPHVEIYKTALGAEDTIAWEKCTTAEEAIERCRQDGYIVIGLEQTTASVKLHHAKFLQHGKYAVVLGNEVNGVNEEALKLCDLIIEIPQLGTKHSLNVSVAAGIVLWQLFSCKFEK
ncbi:MAG: RNA methyltransferase [Flavobacteriales bacterium]|nr:RNA methyltransferase [Flavobacteriales bacterium]